VTPSATPTATPCNILIARAGGEQAAPQAQQFGCDPTGVPISTGVPIATSTPTAMPEPVLGIWYVVCTIPGGQSGVNARNFPTPGGQLTLQYTPGTQLFEYERRRDNQGREWIRVTGYEAYQGQTLWIAIAGGGAVNLTQNAPQGGCGTNIAPTNLPVQPTATITFGSATINCLTGHYCPHTALYSESPNTPDHTILGFVLACEADNNFQDAVNIAWVFRNRTMSGQFRGSIWDVMRQSGQWDCFINGARPTTTLVSTNGGVVNNNILQLASYMITDKWHLIPSPSDLRIRWYSLFTYGTGPHNNQVGNDTVSISDLLISTSNNIIASGQCAYPSNVLLDIFVARSSFGNNPPRLFTTMFFTDSPVC
jgi:hypothetical protein